MIPTNMLVFWIWQIDPRAQLEYQFLAPNKSINLYRAKLWKG